ncbi:unnamed protein product, partial [Scytosiphon promiscuus]
GAAAAAPAADAATPECGIPPAQGLLGGAGEAQELPREPTADSRAATALERARALLEGGEADEGELYGLLREAKDQPGVRATRKLAGKVFHESACSSAAVGVSSIDWCPRVGLMAGRAVPRFLQAHGKGNHPF